MDVRGKKALVIGGTSGIGLAAAQQLLAKGAQVVVMSRSAANLDEARRQLGSGVETHALDVLDRAAMAAAFEALAPFDILVNAATGGERATGPFLKMDLDGFEGSFRKLWGYVNSVRLGAAHLSPNGCVVLVSGFPARKCAIGMAAISTVGNAVEGFMRAVAPGTRAATHQRRLAGHHRYPDVSGTGRSARPVFCGRHGRCAVEARGYRR